MSEELKKCPICEYPYGYFMRAGLYVCPDCIHEWNPDDEVSQSDFVVLDANGTTLQNGDNVIVLKNLP